MTAKKGHEIESLAPVIHSVCEKDGVEVIVDIGTGGVSGQLQLTSSLLHSKNPNKLCDLLKMSLILPVPFWVFTIIHPLPTV